MNIREAREAVAGKLIFGDEKQIEALKVIEKYNSRCLECDGDGAVDCEHCDGTGKETCGACEGTGQEEGEEVMAKAR